MIYITRQTGLPASCVTLTDAEVQDSYNPPWCTTDVLAAEFNPVCPMLSLRRISHVRSHTILFNALLAVYAAVPASADPGTEERLRALELRVDSLQQENEKLRRELGSDGKAGLVDVKPAGKEPVLTVNGLVQVQGDFGDKGDSRGNANDRIRLRRVRLGAAGRFLEEFDFKVEGEYVGASTTLTDAFINWNHYTAANVKAGQFKTPFGYEFLAADPKLYTIERTLGSDRLTLNRQVGVQVSGDCFEKRLSYATGVFNGSGLNTTTNDNGKFLYMGRVSGVPWQGKLFGQAAKWSLGADGFTTKDTALSMASDFGFTGNTFTGQRMGSGIDTQFSFGPFELWAEYLQERFKPVDFKPSFRFYAESWYVQTSCYVLPKELQAVVKYDEFDPNNKKVGDVVGTYTFGLNWFLKGDDIKLQCNYLVSDMPWPTKTQRQLQLRTQVIF